MNRTMPFDRISVRDKANLKKMDKMQINRVAYMHCKYEQLQLAYGLYRDWLAANYE